MISRTILIPLLAITSSATANPVELAERAGVHCGGVGNYAPISDVIGCINAIKAGGTNACEVGPGTGGFCRNGQAVILGSGTGSTPWYVYSSVASMGWAAVVNLILFCDYSQNVAAAAEAILGSCTTQDQYVGGKKYYSILSFFLGAWGIDVCRNLYHWWKQQHSCHCETCLKCVKDTWMGCARGPSRTFVI